MKNLTGEVFNRLTVVSFCDYNRWGKRRWTCRCDCGNETIKIEQDLTNGHSRSCGCLRKEAIFKTRFKHGMYKTKLYRVWSYMKRRCLDANDHNFHYYGGRGISICNEWINDPEAFILFAKENGYKEGLEIDRIDNDGNYCPDNCRFVTRTVNMNNTRVLRKNNSTGFRGVYLYRGKFRVDINISSLPRHSKSGFNNSIDAAIYRDNYCIEHGIETQLNF